MDGENIKKKANSFGKRDHTKDYFSAIYYTIPDPNQCLSLLSQITLTHRRAEWLDGRYIALLHPAPAYMDESESHYFTLCGDSL